MVLAKHKLWYLRIYWTTPSSAKFDIRSIFQQKTSCLNSECSFYYPCSIKAKESRLPYYLLITRWKNKCIHGFKKVMIPSETQTASAMIWNRVTHSISRDGAYYIEHASSCGFKNSGLIVISCTQRCPWCNGYHRRKWTRRYEFKSWTRLIAFHIALISLLTGPLDCILCPHIAEPLVVGKWYRVSMCRSQHEKVAHAFVPYCFGTVRHV